MAKENDSHLSQKGSQQANEKVGVRQHHRLAIGERVDGMKNPNGGAASTKNRIGNNQGKTY